MIRMMMRYIQAISLPMLKSRRERPGRTKNDFAAVVDISIHTHQFVSDSEARIIRIWRNEMIMSMTNNAIDIAEAYPKSNCPKALS